MVASPTPMIPMSSDSMAIKVAVDHLLRDAGIRITLGQSELVGHIVDVEVQVELRREVDVRSHGENPVARKSEAIAHVLIDLPGIFIAHVDSAPSVREKIGRAHV